MFFNPTALPISQGFALDIPAGYGSRGGQKPEARMAEAYAPRIVESNGLANTTGTKLSFRRA
jgi:hypothetical protein